MREMGEEKNSEKISTTVQCKSQQEIQCMAKIVTVVGARPQFVKASVVSRALVHHPEISEILVHTGQHYDKGMSDVFFDELGIPAAKYHLGIGGGTHGQNTGRMIEAIEKVLLEEKPDSVLVYGDTDSTLAAAVAAVKLMIPIAHVEAGLRSFNREMPEEINRILTDHSSTVLFAPTDIAVRNLLREGIASHRIHQTGDVMYDATLHYASIASQKSTILTNLGITPGSYILATVHRKENTDSPERLSNIFQGLGRSKYKIILPLHPRTSQKVRQFGITIPQNIIIIEPVGYLEMLNLERNSYKIATDSGGVQKEAYFLQIPCITMREETEWLELVEAGANVLVGSDPEAIHGALCQDMEVGNLPLYGNGDAGRQIAFKLAQI